MAMEDRYHPRSRVEESITGAETFDDVGYDQPQDFNGEDPGIDYSPVGQEREPGWL